MANRIEVWPKGSDVREKTRRDKLKRLGFTGIEDIKLVDVYTIDSDLTIEQLEKSAGQLSNHVTQNAFVDKPQAPSDFKFAVEFGYLPGVTDNIGATAKQSIEDMLKVEFPPEQNVYSSHIMFLSGDISENDVKAIAENLYNPIIQRVIIKSYDMFKEDNGMGVSVPRVRLKTQPKADVVDLDVPDEELMLIGKQGIRNADGTRRGPLALDSSQMKTIQEYSKKIGRPLFDIEVESLGQTWSEHCKHTIFADPIDELKEGLFKTYIVGATERIRKEKGKKDFCVSVFKDNAGIIEFDDDHDVCDKAETHNTPSALDPYGGSITGIVGVNRDPLGTGLGAMPFLNVSGPFCISDPRVDIPLYRGKNKTQKMLSSRMIMEGIIEGVKDGSNCSGIPTSHLKLVLDKRYRGKPLVFVRTLGIMPKLSCGRKTYEKEAQSGDYIVMAGGRVGQDGIHGATFSSVEMDENSPVTAVQIGDPITQKKLSDAIAKEARDLGLYTDITDNGAGGLSCSVAEMARGPGGCYVYLGKVPLKYVGLEPWKIWVSESQERMTFAVSKDKWEQFSDLMKRRGVEATIIGEFTDSGKCIVEYNGQLVMDVDMDFLHDGLPHKHMHTTYTRQVHEEPLIDIKEDLTEMLYLMLGRLNIASLEFIAQQYDYEVQGGSVVKPLQGRGRVCGDATVTRPVLESDKGVVVSQALYPFYSDIDTYHMAACSIDTAIRNAVVTGSDLDYLALMDNFCWCSSNDPERLGQLKEAVRACYDYAVAYSTPFISGKDSMFNDFKGYDKDGNPVEISVPPTLLISSTGIIHDSKKAVTLDAKRKDDLVYVLNDTYDELGGSEYFAMTGEMERGEKYIGNNVPKVDAMNNKKLYYAFSDCINEGIIASAISVQVGGLGVALAKTAMGGMLGMDVSLENLPGNTTRDDFAVFSESQGRIVVTVAPQYKDKFEEMMQGNSFALVGKVTGGDSFVVRGRNGERIVDAKIESMLSSYRATFEGY